VSETFQRYDYVLYVGPVKFWRDFYVVHGINPDGTVRLRDVNGDHVNDCDPTHIRLLYRPTAEEREHARGSRDGQ
jgi:hypothetical protein